MSYQNFVKAMDLAPKCKFYTTVGGKSKEEIELMRKIAKFTDEAVLYAVNHFPIFIFKLGNKCTALDIVSDRMKFKFRHYYMQ